MLAGQTADGKAEIMARHWLFAQLDRAELERLARHARIERVKAQQVIFRKGDPGLGLIAVLKGRVKISASSLNDREVVLNMIEEGEIFGEIALLDGDERTADATAMAPTELLVLDRRDFLPVLEKHPEMSRRVMEMLCRRLRRTSDQLEDAIFLVQTARLAKVILRLAQDYGVGNGRTVRIDLALSQREIGAMVGMRREAMNRQLAKWRAEGRIAMAGRTLSIPDIEAFEAYAEELIWSMPD